MKFPDYLSAVNNLQFGDTYNYTGLEQTPTQCN